jgi:hypothetical protein
MVKEWAFAFSSRVVLMYVVVFPVIIDVALYLPSSTRSRA